jgi:hypothetical protein
MSAICACCADHRAARRPLEAVPGVQACVVPGALRLLAIP